ncbi:MAG: hypothetical protein QM536_00835 [Chitinophagaceae bacterium]|nr:hypothetical protein [Chitinophagaceae bacterium]
MNRTIIFFMIAALCFQNLQAQEGYKVYINLNKVKNDQIQVRIQPPPISKNEVEYHIPKIVPGTYSIYDFGRFVSSFYAYDSLGKPLEVDSLDENRWLIKNAKQLKTIEYWVEDSYDTDKDNVIFEPAGTSIQKDTFFLLNTHGFIGYIDGKKNTPYQLSVEHPEKFYGSTSLLLKEKQGYIDIFEAENYNFLVDAPLMYNIPDTTTFVLGGTSILISVFSPNNFLSSHSVAKEVQEVLHAQKNYMGGTLPIEKYAFIIHIFPGHSKSGSYGALEHSYSSVYSFPEIKDSTALSRSIRDIAAHEFFHIITPLNIHSEEIGNFNFIAPQMSKHLWMYEGVTEYFATHAQICNNILTEQDYFAEITDKIQYSKNNYNDTVPFTVMSQKCLEEYKDEYGNVYQKGALIGLCLDVKLRELSKGKYSVMKLLQDLSLEYGKHKSFADDILFDKITALTFPEIRDFFTKYVEGKNPLPLKEIFHKIGYHYTDTVLKVASMGNISFESDTKNTGIKITDVSQANAFGLQMGYQAGDILYKLNGMKIHSLNGEKIIAQYQAKTHDGDKVTAVVIRIIKGKQKKVKLSAPALLIDKKKFSLTENKNSTTEQQQLKDWWKKNYKS